MSAAGAGLREETQAPGPGGRLLPRCIVTVDTEGDNLWTRPRTVTTENARWLPRFQGLAERYGLKPVYLTSYEMACSPIFREFGREVLERGLGEIGMHLHAWNTPPLVSLTVDDWVYQPYLTEYPTSVMEQKIRMLTRVLEDTFDTQVTSHRAGRWGLNSVYAGILVREGYRVDCSVTPLVSWQSHRGDPRGQGGPDYLAFPREPYFVDLDDIGRPGAAPLLEVPVTIEPGSGSLDGLRKHTRRFPLAHRVLNRIVPAVYWLRPNGRNLREMVGMVRAAAQRQRPCIEFMVHSSELMPGGSPYFPRSRDVDALYRDIEAIFEVVQENCVGATLRDFYDEVVAGYHAVGVTTPAIS